jgi:RNA-directed DNA polymerase
MKEPHIKGLATHGDLESCVGAREGDGEALTGACTGSVLSREMNIVRGADVVIRGGRQHEPSAITQALGRPCAVVDPKHVQNLPAREPGDLQATPRSDGARGRVGKAVSRTPTMNGLEKSDGFVVPTKPLNEAAHGAAEEVVEGRNPAKGNMVEQNAPRTQSRTSAHSALGRVREAARRDRKMQFTTLLHHITTDLLREAYHALKRKAAAGVDGVRWDEYGQDLEVHLKDLFARIHGGAYRAKPSRRVYIPKPDGRQRPLGIAALEDKIVQRAVVEVLNAIYEVDFLGFSYGFRPGRGQHDALDALATAIMRKKVNWVLDADIRGYFDAIDHEWLVKFVKHRIADTRVVRLIQKWLAAGVLEAGKWSETEEGTPQGATISPLLANIYLHYVLDLWVQHWRRHEARGEVVIVRYADDFVLGFQYEADAVRFRTALQKRLGNFGLEVHPDKTRLFRFGRYAEKERHERGQGKPETFDFLGFTHICGKARSGKFLLLRHTTRKRMTAKLKVLREELRRRRHLPLPEQGQWVESVVRGYFAYHAVPSNIQRLAAFRTQVIRSWHHALRRRGQRNRMTWMKMARLANHWIPAARVQHPYPWNRFEAMTQGKSRVR